MNKAITMNIRMDEETRRGLKDFAGQLGIPATSLVNASIKQMLRAQQITFSTSLQPTPYLQKIIKQADADYAKGKNISPVFDSADDMLKHLKASA
ncbi:MAG: hypothetical protein ACREGA_04115 [Candidatus Saccharimonadales bacterium]